jgi:hypothetical protein
MDNSKQDKIKKAEPKKAEPKKTEQKKGDYKSIVFPFNKDNYKLLLIGLAFIVVGFILMIGGGNNDPKVFNYAIFNFQRLTLSPILLSIGYIIEIYAIMKLPKEKKAAE